MAEFLDKLKQSIDKGITTVGVKSKEMIETQRVRSQLSALEDKKKRTLEDLGVIFYTRYRIDKEHGIEKTTLKSMRGVELGQWDNALFEVLNDLCEGRFKNELYEESQKDFKITAEVLLNKVKEILPKLDKPQPSQWLGKMLSKFNLASEKITKRIRGKLETIYVFNRERVHLIMEKATTEQHVDEESIRVKCFEIEDLDNQIKKKQEQLNKIRLDAKIELQKQP